MESKRNKKIFNTIMVAVIAVIAIGGVISVGFIKGWFSDEGEQAALAGKVTGVVNIERKEFPSTGRRGGSADGREHIRPTKSRHSNRIRRQYI